MRRMTSLAAYGMAVLLLGAPANAGDTIWSIFADEETVGTFDTDTPHVFEPLPNNLGFFAPGLAFDASGTLYCTDLSNLYEVDRVFGISNPIGAHGATVNMQDLAFDHTTGTLLGTATDAGCGGGDTIYAIDTSTGAATAVCSSTTSTCAVGLAIDNAGTAYLQDIVTDSIYSLDLSSCAEAFHVALGFDANFSQGMTVNPNTNDGWVLGFNNVSFVGELYAWDLDVPSLSFAGNLGGGGTFNEHNDGDIEIDTVELLNFPFMTLSGSCPGRVDIMVEHCTPGKKVALLYSRQEGEFIVPNNQLCAGTTLGIKRPRVARLVDADENGVALFSGQMPGNLCDNLFLQAVDLFTCETTDVTLVPEGAVEHKECEYKITCILEAPNGTCSTAVWDAIKARANKFYFFNKCKVNGDCPDAGAVWYDKAKVKYKDAAGDVRTCEVEVKVESTGRCVQPVAVPWKAMEDLEERDCDPDYTF